MCTQMKLGPQQTEYVFPSQLKTLFAEVNEL